LIGMRERAELIGARLTIHSSPGAGAAIELQLPLSASDFRSSPPPTAFR
jgi:nitrate/nitrite-specific signal transduction histidine kinase